MPNKLQFYSEFAERTARQITGSYRSWTAFLATAARLYKYPYNEQLMIYAQRPNATACAEYDFWKDRMGRYVQRGSTGIALIDTSGYQPRLRYVFDVADTAPRDAARNFTLWEMRTEHEAKVCSMLTEQYDVPQDGGIIAQFERVADKLALEYWTEQKRDICDIIADSFLSGYDEDNIRMAFKTAASTSITYALMARCGFSPDGYFEPEDFMPVFDFNTPAAVSVLGTAVSEISQRVLRQIEITVKRHERKRRAERTEEHGEQPDLQDQRRISDPRPEPARESAEPAAWQIRTDAADVSPGASPDPLESDDPDGNAFSAPAGDRRSGEPEVGADDAGADDVGRSDGSAESSRPIEVGRSDEHLQGASRGSDPRGADLRITEPVQGEQISFMPEAENVQTSSASSALDYNSIKEAHPDDIVLYQVGDFFEIYGEDARQAAELLNMNLTTRNIPGAGRVEMCGVPAHSLEMYVEKLRDKYDVTIAEAPDFRGERHIYTLRSIDHEAEAAINAYEAEFGADGTRVFRDPAAEQVQPTVQEHLEHYRPVVMAAVSEDTAYRNACGHSDRENAGIECNAAVRRAVLNSKDMELIRLFSDVPEFRNHLHQEVFEGTYERLRDLLRPLSQDDIDDALRTWNGNIESKHAVVRYMQQHGREKETAAWLAHEYGGKEGNNLFIVRAGSPETAELTWSKVQRRIAQLIREDQFFTEQEKSVLEQEPNYGDYPDEKAQAQVSTLKETGMEATEQPTPELPQAVQTLMGQRVEIDGTLYTIDSADETVAHLSNVPSSSENNHEPEHRTEPLSAVLTRITDQGRELAPNVSAYQALCAEHPEKLVGVRVGERLLFYGADAERAASVLNRRLLQRDIPGVGETAVTGYDFGQWASAAKRLLEHGHSFVFAQPNETDGYDVINEADAKEYIPIGMELEIDGRKFVIDSVNFGTDEVSLRDVTFQSHTGYPIFRAEHVAFVRSFVEEQQKPLSYTIQPVEVYAAEENHLPYDVVIQTLHVEQPEQSISAPEPEQMPQTDAQTAPPQGNTPTAQNFRITDDLLGTGGAKAKFRANMDAINLLKELEFDGRQATPEEQNILSKYVGWGGLADAFDESKDNWKDEFAELYATLSPEEYAAARASTLNAHYTSPTVIKAIYEAVENMGFQTGNILEPSMGVGNFFGCLPEQMQGSKLYGVELDSITGRIAKQLYPQANITVAGFETTNRRDFYDLAIGNVPFGQYQVNDRAYNKLGFSIHNYFFAKALDQVRPGGVIAFVTSRYTMDSKDDRARKYIAERAELLGAIRLPNNAFKANAGTDVVSDILFLQKREQPSIAEPEWTQLGENADGFSINNYFIHHPEMILGRQSAESTQYGKQDFTVEPLEGADLSAQLHEAVQHIGGIYQAAELPDLGEEDQIQDTIPADPDVKNYSYTLVDGEVYYRENSVMVKPDLNTTAKERVKGMIELRDCVQSLISQQMDGVISDMTIQQTQQKLNRLYDTFTDKYGLINARANSLAFSDDSSYYLLCSLEILNENGDLERKADIFTKRTIKPHEVVTSVDTASEALALSISEKACVDMHYMAQLSGKSQDELIDELNGVIFLDPTRGNWQTADEYLSGNVRQKLRQAEAAAVDAPGYAPNVEALRQAQPKDLDASEIEVRLGATWIDKDYIQQFMYETFNPAYYRRHLIQVNYSPSTAEWNIGGKSTPSKQDVNAYMTYGTERANAYRILEDTLNLRDVRIYDTVYDADGTERRVLNSKETTLAQQKQQAIKDAFQEWIWRDPNRRQTLVQQYNERFNSIRPREYDGSHIRFSGMNPEITLREHQKNAIAHILYGGNTLLAHEVGAGKTFEMVAAVMESKRLGLCQKAMFVVPNHLTEQWASEFLRLYPSANILVTTKKDFETRNRKKFCARIATGDYDAVIIGHSQFEKIPISKERQEHLLQEQIYEIEDGIRELRAANAERFTIKSLERTKRGLELRLQKLQAADRKDDVVTFEQLGIDRLYVDEAHSYKNLFLYTKMRNVAGLSTSDAQKSSDMLLKCRYIDEITDGKGVVFATGTPVSNSMTELFTMMRYLQHDLLQQKGLAHFDCWASTFGETTTAIELAPEGTGYRARTRFAKFYNLPELMSMFKIAADIKTADQLHLPRPEAVYHTEVSQPTAIQKEMVQMLSERAAKVHSGTVDPSNDNMLKITSDGRKLGLDQRIINPDLPDDPSSKVNRCVDNIFRIWQDGQADKLTQLVFCDLSTPKIAAAKRAEKPAGGALDNPELHALETQLASDGITSDAPFSVYDDIRSKLVALGIPREQIAYIHEANTEVRKKELFAKVRSGQVRVLMGSTFKMGAGMNVQDRLIALHDLDCPWRPGDLEQRGGRIIRQGNRNKEVHIYRYVTEGTFDAYLWQTIENKQRFISQIMTSKSPVRSCEDIDETALSYAEIKALCAGDERIKEKMDLDVDVARLRLMRASHQSQQYKLEDNLLRYFPEQIEAAKNAIAGLETDMQTVAAHPHPTDGFAGMEVKGDLLTDKDNAGAALLEAFKEVKDSEPVPVGSYRGFQTALTAEGFYMDCILTLKGQMSHRVELGKDARGNLTRIDNVLNAIPARLNSQKVYLENLYAQMEAAKTELGKPFPQEEELRVKSARLAELNAELNIDDKMPMERLAGDTDAIAKSTHPSILQKLHAPLPEQTNSKPKHKEMEVSR